MVVITIVAYTYINKTETWEDTTVHLTTHCSYPTINQVVTQFKNGLPHDKSSLLRVDKGANIIVRYTSNHDDMFLNEEQRCRKHRRGQVLYLWVLPCAHTHKMTPGQLSLPPTPVVKHRLRRFRCSRTLDFGQYDTDSYALVNTRVTCACGRSYHYARASDHWQYFHMTKGRFTNQFMGFESMIVGDYARAASFFHTAVYVDKTVSVIPLLKLAYQHLNRSCETLDKFASDIGYQDHVVCERSL